MPIAPPALLDQIRWPSSAFTDPQPDPETARRVKAALGAVPEIIPYLAPLPWLVDAFMALATYKPRHVPPNLAEMVHLVVAQDNSCRYCYGTTRTTMKVMGFPEELLRKIETDLREAPLSARDSAALSFVRKVSRCNPRVGKEELAALAQAGFSREAVAELTFLASAGCFANRLATLLAVPPDSFEKMDGAVGRLLRPVLAWMMKRPRPSWPVPPPPPGAERFPSLGEALKGLDAAPLVEGIAHLAWESQALPKRAKALAIGVIARGIGCEVCEVSARRMLLQQGLAEEAIDEGLRHLSSAALDPFEIRLAQFARETIRYQLPQLHLKCREAFQGLSREAVLEIAGIVSLANCVTRLTVLLEP